MRPMSGFTYKKVRTLEEAWEAASRYSEGARYLAGGTDLLVRLKKGEIRTPCLVGLKGIRDLSGVTECGDEIDIGPLTTVHEVVWSELLKEKYPLLTLAAIQLGSAQIRNMATIGGNLCNASPAGDLSVALFCLEARVKIDGPEGARSEKIDNFFHGPGQTSLRSTEIMTAILVPVTRGDWLWNYRKLGIRRAMEIGIVNVAIGLNLEEGICKEVRIALGSVGPTPIRARRAENLMGGKKFSPELVEEVAELSARESEPIDDFRASRAYRREMVINLVRRSLITLWQAPGSERGQRSWPRKGSGSG